MLDPYETTALWTIAGTDLKPQLGVLHYAPDSGLRVDLDWLPQEDASGWLRASSEKTVTVRGDRSMGSPLMLEDCAVVPDKGIPGYGCLKIHASIAFLGLDADDPASIQYTGASFTATQLSSWCDDLSGFVHPSESMSVEMTDGLRLFAGRNQRRLMSHCRVPPSILVWLTQSARAGGLAAFLSARASSSSSRSRSHASPSCSGMCIRSATSTHWCVFRSKPNTDSAPSRTLIPRQVEHRFRSKPNTDSAGKPNTFRALQRNR